MSCQQRTRPRAGVAPLRRLPRQIDSRTAPLHLVVLDAASSDPTVATLADEMAAQRLTGMTLFAPAPPDPRMLLVTTGNGPYRATAGGHSEKFMTIHREPFVHLAGLTHDDALIAWGAFFFVDAAEGRGWRIVEDPELDDAVEGPRRESIGVSSRPYGDAQVEVVDPVSGQVAARAETSQRNHVWVRGLQPDTAYQYHVTVDGREWVGEPRRSWRDTGNGSDLVPADRRYDTRFRTFPPPDAPASLRFAILGDYGVGILAADGVGERQRQLAGALERAVDHAGVRLVITTGDNIYLGEEDTVAGTGNEDVDWYFSFYEPYRDIISRIPVYPGVGNHDTGDTEHSDDRRQLADNLFTGLRFAEGAEVGRASVDPGLFYRFSYGSSLHFVAVDSTEARELGAPYFVNDPRHRAFLAEELTGHPDGWRIPFSHHPPFCAGPKHHDTGHLVDAVVPLLHAGGVRVMFSGHEHNFQHNRVEGIDYFVTGSAGKLREARPDRFEEAGTRSWAAEGHLLIVDVNDERMLVHPVTDVAADGRFTYLRATTPEGQSAAMPIVIPR